MRGGSGCSCSNHQVMASISNPANSAGTNPEAKARCSRRDCGFGAKRSLLSVQRSPRPGICASSPETRDSLFRQAMHDSACAGYFGHPFPKSETCAKAISLPSCIAVTKRDMSKIVRTGKPPLTKLAGRGMTWSLRLRKENPAANTKTRTALDVTLNPYDVEFSSFPLGAYPFHGFCCPLVVMVSPTQHSNGHPLARLLRRRTGKPEEAGPSSGRWGVLFVAGA